MKDDHLTLRLPRDLARALARWAESRGLSKSQIVREAVAEYVARPRSAPARESARPTTALELARRWPMLARLDAEEAGAFEADLAAARRRLPAARDPWA